ncbi:MAG: hypothetical protein WDN26_08240 [Chitinophagaceae bacterium]
MKKMIITLAVAVSSLFAFAGEGNVVNAEVLNAFNKEFTGATDVQWTSRDNYFRANFVFNDQYVSAFYSADGEMMGLTRNISSLQLPIKLQTKLKKSYSNYWISDLFEVSNNDGTKYYITVEDADTKIILQSTDYNSWTKTAKS